MAGAGVAANLALVALTILELGQGGYRAALDAGWPLFESDASPQGTQILPDLVEAAVRSGDRERADAALDRLTIRARASSTPWALGVLARARALTAADADAEGYYRESIEQLGRTWVLTDRARAHLLYGEWLRRENRRLESREELRAAHEMFVTMGAQGFADRARAELVATGERVRKRNVETSNDLTPQEAQIAGLAATGMTRSEIAAKLFLSMSTIDYHLRKVYRKLDVTSRGQLRKVLPHSVALTAEAIS